MGQLIRRLVMVGVCAGFAHLALLSVMHMPAEAAHPCKAQIDAVISWRTAMYQEILRRKLPRDQYNAVWEPYKKSSLKAYNDIWQLKNPSDCQRVASTWCAEMTRDYGDYGIACS